MAERDSLFTILHLNNSYDGTFNYRLLKNINYCFFLVLIFFVILQRQTITVHAEEKTVKLSELLTEYDGKTIETDEYTFRIRTENGVQSYSYIVKNGANIELLVDINNATFSELYNSNGKGKLDVKICDGNKLCFVYSLAGNSNRNINTITINGASVDFMESESGSSYSLFAEDIILLNNAKMTFFKETGVCCTNLNMDDSKIILDPLKNATGNSRISCTGNVKLTNSEIIDEANKNSVLLIWDGLNENKEQSLLTMDSRSFITNIKITKNCLIQGDFNVNDFDVDFADEVIIEAVRFSAKNVCVGSFSIPSPAKLTICKGCKFLVSGTLSGDSKSVITILDGEVQVGFLYGNDYSICVEKGSLVSRSCGYWGEGGYADIISDPNKAFFLRSISFGDGIGIVVPQKASVVNIYGLDKSSVQPFISNDFIGFVDESGNRLNDFKLEIGKIIEVNNQEENNNQQSDNNHSDKPNGQSDLTEDNKLDNTQENKTSYSQDEKVEDAANASQDNEVTNKSDNYKDNSANENSENLKKDNKANENPNNEVVISKNVIIKQSKKKVDISKVKKKDQKVSIEIEGSKGKITAKNVSTRKIRKYMSIKVKGRKVICTIKKGAKKGKYKAKITVAKDESYKKTSKTICIEVK